MAFLYNRSLTLGSRLIFGMKPAATNFCQRRFFNGRLVAPTACFNGSDVKLLRRAHIYKGIVHSVHTLTQGTSNSTDALNKVSLSVPTM